MYKCKLNKRLIAAVVAFSVGITGSFSAAFADTAEIEVNAANTGIEEKISGYDENSADDGVSGDSSEEDNGEVSSDIVEISWPEAGILKQTITAYSGITPKLPETLAVRTEGSETFKDVDVKWSGSSTYDNKKAGIYKYTCMLPAEYSVANGVILPQITVTVARVATSITGMANQRTKKARTTLYHKVNVYNGYGSTLKVQMYSDGKWLTKKTIALKNINKETVNIAFPNNWWKVTSSKWRIAVVSTPGTTGATSNICTVKTTRYYQNPSKYVQIQDKIKIDNSGSYTLKKGYMGLKVRQVNRYFGIGNRYWPRYTSATKAKVKAFQKKKGLKATGNVNKATWLKMGFSEKTWKNMGAYVSPVKVNPSSTKKQHIEAMIDRAYDYLGSDYVVGASGKPSQGADCSGIVMQALYAAGVEIKGINPVTHSWAGHEFESRNIWNKADFKKVSYKKKKRGDLIFYAGPSGYVNHIAIYLGNGKVIESWPNKVRIAKVGHHKVKGVMRVFN